MAEVINNSTAYDAGGVGSGVGAAVLPTGNLTQINQAWNQQNAQDEADADKAEKERVVNAKALISDLNPNVKGALDSDADYFRGKVADIQGREAELYKKYNGNPTSPDAMLQHKYLLNEKNNLENEAALSGNHKAILLKEAQMLDADKGSGEGKYDFEQSANRLAQLRIQPTIQDREKLLNSFGGTALVKAPINADAELTKARVGLSKDQTEMVRVQLPNGQVRETSLSGWTEPQLERHAIATYNDNPKVQRGYDERAAYLEKNNPTGYDAIKAQADKKGYTVPQMMAVNNNLNYAFQKQKDKILAETPEHKLAMFKERRDYMVDHPLQNDSYMYKKGLDATTGDPLSFATPYHQDNETGDYVARGSQYDNLDFGRANFPEFKLNKTTNEYEPTGQVSNKPNRIRMVIGNRDINGNPMPSTYITDADIAQKGYDPSQMTNEQIFKIRKRFEQPWTQASVDAAFTANPRLKLNRDNFYKEKGNEKYKNMTPTSINVPSTEVESPFTNTSVVQKVQPKFNSPVVATQPTAQPAQKPSTSSYTPVQEKGIKAVMDKNNISREQAIQALKDAKKL